MKYKIVRENKPTLKNYGRYKAVAMHFQTISPEEVEQEIEDNCSAKSSDVKLVLNELSQVLQRHLKQGDRVRLEGLGLLKLEIESEKVEAPQDFRPQRDIRGVRLHFLPERSKGAKALYKDIRFEKWKE
jgi:predicted histone-like DNA-binding protein